MAIITGVLFAFFFIVFCLYCWFEYLSFKRKISAIRQAKQKTQAEIDHYDQSKTPDITLGIKEAHQRLKKKQLDAELDA